MWKTELGAFGLILFQASALSGESDRHGRVTFWGGLFERRRTAALCFVTRNAGTSGRRYDPLLRPAQRPKGVTVDGMSPLMTRDQWRFRVTFVDDDEEE